MERNRSWAGIAPLMALALFVAFSAMEIQSSDSVDCVEFLNFLDPGETVDIAIDEPDWQHLSTWPKHVYRLEVTGSDDSSLELWETFFDSGNYCYRAVDLQATRQISGGVAEFEWASGWRRYGIKISPVSGETENFSLALSELAAPPGHYSLIIPAVAHTPGSNQTFFQTDLRMFNFAEQDASVELVFVPTQGNKQYAEVVVRAQEILAIDDVVLSQFGLEAGTGALKISHNNGSVIAISRTYNSSATGSYGQFIPAQLQYDAAGSVDVFSTTSDSDPTRILLGLAKSENFRSNVGFVEVLGLDANLELELFNQAGALVASTELLLPAFSHRQINDVFDFLAAPALDNASLTVKLQGLAWVFSYASVVDNLSSDPIFIPGLSPNNIGSVQVVPAAAAGPGSNDTSWQSDLRVLAVDDTTTVEVTFFPSNSSSPASETFDLGDGILAIDGVVSSLGASGSGALRLQADGPILATSRTYNVTDNGTLGQFIPAQDEGSRITHGTVIGVDRSADFRTNIGMFSPEVEVDVDIRLVSGTGALLGSGTWHLEAGSHIQIHDIFAALNTPWQTNCRVDFDVVDAWTSIYAYASVIDNHTGDPIYIPATYVWAELASDLELSNRENAFLIDQLPEAVGVTSLPAGTLTATVTGSGDLGRENLPIQVLCLYKNGLGELSSTVLAIGDSVSDIAGGERFWCVLPDWISRADNSGEVTVTITGGDDEVRLVLDARDNAVLLDQQEAAILAVHPRFEAYRVAITGDLGRPELDAQVVVMHRDADSGQLRVRTAADGELVGGIDTDFQLLAVVLDWLNRDDNTGSTILEPTCMTRPGACNGSVTGSISKATDCNSTPSNDSFYWGEAITFEGTAGQQITITATWEERGAHLYLVDPNGTVIAQHEVYPPEPVAEFSDVTLSETGTYTIWVTSTMWEEGYTVTITCDEP